MEVKKEETKDFFNIDIAEIVKNIWFRLWLVILCGIIGGSVGFIYARYYITPTYSASTMLYVNSTSISLGGQKLTVSSSDISMARNLIDTYVVILKSRTTLEAIADEAGVKYSSGQLDGMISASSVGETEVLRVTVISTDPYEAAKIANAISVVLPQRIAMVISGASMEVVDSAIPNTWRIAPVISKYAITGFAIGFIICAAVIALLTIMDGTVHDVEYVRTNYSFPVLARIPDLHTSPADASKGYGGYGYGYGYGYGGYGGYGYGYGKKEPSKESDNKTEEVSGGKEQS